MKLGLIVAIETDAVFDYYRDYQSLPCPRGFDLYRIAKDPHEIYVLHTGMGEIAAAAGTQYLITACGVQTVVNFGVVGGLKPDMDKVYAIDRVVHYKYDCSEFMDLAVGQVDGHDSVYLPTDPTLLRSALAACPALPVATCCSADKFVGTAREKQAIAERFDGDVCDMESAGIVLTCEANGVPCLMLKAVADSLTGGAGEFYEELKSAAYQCMVITDRILERL